MKFYLLILFSLKLTFISSLAFSNEEPIPKVLLKYNIQTLNSGDQSYLVFNFSNIKHWHTYWKNPGDAGFGPKFKMTTNKGDEVLLTQLEWPSPSRFIEPGNIWAYGYEGDYSFFYKLPKNFNQVIDVELNWLICKHICIPGKSDANITIERSSLIDFKIYQTDLLLNKVSLSEMRKRLNKIPSKISQSNDKIDIVLSKDSSKENMLALYYNTQSISDIDVFNERNLLFPYPHPYLEFKHEKLFTDKNGAVYAKMLVEWNGIYEEPEIPFPKDLKLPNDIMLSFDYFSEKDGRSYRINKNFSKLYDGKKLNDFLQILTPINLTDKNSEKTPNLASEDKANELEILEFLRFILFALIGGFILNFMPCVLPVISIKIFGLISQSNQTRSQILSHNLLYTLGVLSTFTVLALIIILLKMSGQAIGWGFQMQSPTFVASITIFLFVFALNLFGLYEFITPGGNSLASVQLEGKKGDFLNGVLATVLSTPCSAPFLGTALAFAFTSGPLVILSVFISVGVGLASPFIITAFFPGFIKVFPKPGSWMITFKKFLGFTLIATVVWLLTIFVQLKTNQLSLFILLGLFIIIPVTILIHQKYKKNFVILIIALAITLGGISIIHFSSPQNTQKLIAQQDTIKKFGLTRSHWNPDIINENQNARVVTFIDFTADWCLTCKVNEKLVINTKKFRDFVAANKINLILGDWTDGDPEMTKWLQANDMAGVPAYFVIDADGNLHNLGETVSISKIKEALNN